MEASMLKPGQDPIAEKTGKDKIEITEEQQNNGPITEKSIPKSATREEAPTRNNATDLFSVFPRAQKRWIVFLIAFAGMFSPMSSFIYYPAISSIAEDLRVSVESVNLTVTSYMIVSGIVPAIMGNLADTMGRRPVYMVVFSIYILANIGLAIQRSFPALFALRMLQSAGSSGTISLGYGVIADIATPAERGLYVGVVLLGPNVAPPVGPLLGGAIAARLGWNYIFWFLCGLSGICLLTIILSLPETARCIVGNGSLPPPKAIYKTWLPLLLRQAQVPNNPPAEAPEGRRRPLRQLPNPIRSLKVLLEKDSAIILVCNGIFYATYCCLQASLSSLFIQLYGYRELQAGLIYIPFGVGCLVASFLSGKLLNMDYALVAKAHNMGPDERGGDDDFPIEKARLRSIFYPVCVSVVAIIGYGWALERRADVSVPLIIQAITGMSITSIFTTLGTLLTDIHPKTSSTAAAAANIVRCTLAAAGTSILQLLIDAVGVGWCFTLIGVICGFCIPLLLIEREKGAKWRISRRD